MSIEELKVKITKDIYSTDVQMLQKVFPNLLKRAMACQEMGWGSVEFLNLHPLILGFLKTNDIL